MVEWNIVRHGPKGKVYGRAFPTFLKNRNFYVSRVKVYADGVVNSCVGSVDLDLFRRGELLGPPISPQPPIGSIVVVPDLGSAKVAEAEWMVSWNDVVAEVEKVI